MSSLLNSAQSKMESRLKRGLCSSSLKVFILMFLIEKEFDLTNCELLAKNEEYKKEIESLKKEKQLLVENHEKELHMSSQQQEKRLEEIDDKIRKMLQGKSNEISKLQHKLQQQQSRYKELEETLNELNRNLASVR
jgi:predicted RNase H-like nuclease (RuvC/YqgF family)